MDLFEELEKSVDVLVAGDVEYALCGGLALAVHGYPRFTKDIDLLVRREDVETVVRLARGLGYTVDAGEIPFDVQGPRSRTVRRIGSGCLSPAPAASAPADPEMKPPSSGAMHRTHPWSDS